MAFPNWVFQANFETGDDGDFTTASTSDADNRLIFPHLSELAQSSVYKPTPLRGAYAMVVDCRHRPGATWSACYVQADDAFDTTVDSGTLYYGFNFMVTPDMEANSGDTVRLVDVQASGGTNTPDIMIGYSDIYGWRVSLIDASGASINEENATQFNLGEWVHVAVYNEPKSSNGVSYFYVNGERRGEGNTDWAQASITHARVGAIDQAATMKGGLIVFDEIIADDTDRPYPLGMYDPDTGATDADPLGNGKAVINKTSHLALGGGTLTSIVVDGATGSNAPIRFYDTGRMQKRESTFLYSTLATPDTFNERDFENGLYVTCSDWGTATVILEFEEEVDDREELGEYGATLEKPSDDD